MGKKPVEKNNSFKALITSSLAYLAIGLIMIIFPNLVGTTLCLAIGIIITVYGIFSIFTYFARRGTGMQFNLVVGVLATAFGIFALLSPAIIKNIVFTIIGIFIIIGSLIEINHAFLLKNFNMRFWWIYLLVSVLVIILGICILLFQSFFANILIILLGILMIYEGVSGISIYFLLNRYAKKYKSRQNMIDAEAEDADDI